MARASATAMEAAATLSAVGSAVAASSTRPERRSSSASAARLHVRRQAARWPIQRQRIVAGLVDAGVDPGPGALADETQGVLEGAAGDPGVDGRVQNLRERADGGRALEGVLERDHVVLADLRAIEHHAAAAGGALAEAGPVVDDFEPGAVARDEGQLLEALVVDRQRRNALRIQRAGAVELAAVNAQAAVLALEARGAIMGGTRADLRQRVAEAHAGQHLGEQAGLSAAVVAVHPQHFEGIEMVLRNLPQRAVGGGDDGDHPRHGDAGDARAAILARHGDAPQAGGLEKSSKFCMRQAPLAVALQLAPARKQGGQLPGRPPGPAASLRMLMRRHVDCSENRAGSSGAPQIQE